MSPKISLPSSCDVLVAGSGNAGLCAAIAAREAGALRVTVIDKCPEEWLGGNTFFTAGAFRTVHDGLRDLLPLVNNIDSTTSQRIDLEPYSKREFENDLKRTCGGKSDPHLANVLVRESNSVIKWLATNGVRFQLSLNRQAYEVDGRLKFWGGMALRTQDGGKGLVHDLKAAAQRHDISIFPTTSIERLNLDPITSSVQSVEVNANGHSETISVKAVILATGGFESNANLRIRHLGVGWDKAKVRGTPFNTGDGLEIAVRYASARKAGDWSGCHSVCWDANAADNAGDRIVSNEYTKSGYPLGLMLNIRGERFVDEGLDLRNFTYAKFGRAVLQQPGSTAFQIWDSQTIKLLRSEEYRSERAHRIMANSIPELANCLLPLGLQDAISFVNTICGYNEAVYAFREENADVAWNPAVKDALSTQSQRLQLSLPKSNWALPLDKPPFMAVQVSCGITFTFGGVAIDPETSQVMSSKTGHAVPGLYAAGEMVGNLFHDNYPGGSGLTSGAVFGRNAGIHAAKLSQQMH